MKNDYILIGIDGGATKVNACQVIYDESGTSFSLSDFASKKIYPEIPGYLEEFEPVGILIQLKEFKENNIRPSLDEKQQEAVIVEACAKAVLEICEQTGKTKILPGIGMPGLKTFDKRGVAVMANGPRMTQFSMLLEQRLALESIDLVRPVAHLGSDADYCGIGENFAQDGLLKDVENAYYLGGGSGVADALKLNGKLVPFDEIKLWMAKTWEMQSADGISLEKYISAKGVQSVYAELSGKSVTELEENGIHIARLAELADQGNEQAIKTFDKVSKFLAALLFERIVTLFAGWQGLFSFANSSRKITEIDHPYRNTVFDGIVLGQRLGQVLSTESGFAVLGKPMIKELSTKIENSALLSVQAKNHYADLENIIKFSTLRDAPALGAGIDAYNSWR